jgi:predicted GTPase
VTLRTFILAALTMPLVFFLNACSRPKIYPVTQTVEDVKKENDRRIKESPVLQAIDNLCTKEIPTFDGFKLINRAAWEAPNTLISYTYRCDTADNMKVRDFYKNYLSRQGWKITKAQIDGIGPPWILESRKADQTVSLTYYGAGEGGDIYSLTCTKAPAPR